MLYFYKLFYKGFKYATSLYFNMGYYHIRLMRDAINICGMILQWGKCKYKQLSIGVCNPQDISQREKNKISLGFKYILAYLDYLLVLMIGDWTNYLTNMEQVLIKIQKMI